MRRLTAPARAALVWGAVAALACGCRSEAPALPAAPPLTHPPGWTRTGTSPLLILGPVEGVAGGGDDRLLGLGLDPQGRLLAAGRSRDPAGVERTLLLRFHPDGQPDQAFGVGGAWLGPAGRLLVVRAQGERLVAAGRASLGRCHLGLLLALRPDGRWDRSFGPGGPEGARPSLVLGAGGGRPFTGADFNGACPDEQWADLAVDPAGRLWVAGKTGEVSGAWLRGPGLSRALYWRALLARFDPQGALDPGFSAAVGPDGARWSAPHDELNQLALLPDGGVAAAGWAAGDLGYRRERGLLLIHGPGGELRAGGLGPERSAAGGTKEVYYGVALDGAEGLLLAGFSFDAQGRVLGLVERRELSGAAAAWGAGGRVLEPAGALAGAPVEYLVRARRDASGRVWAAGFSDQGPAYGEACDQALLVRYWPDGQRDSTFAAGGVLRLGPGGLAGRGAGFFDLLLDPTGGAWAAGTQQGRALLVRVSPR